MTCMTSSFEVCTVLEEIMHHLDHKRDVNIASIQRLLTQLRLRSQSLPSELRFSTTEWPMSVERQRQALGSSTVACIYYFSVILITRPVLISLLLRKLTAASQGSSSHTSSPKVEEIGQVCVDAAVLMAETARSAQAAGILLQNMCMLKYEPSLEICERLADRETQGLAVQRRTYPWLHFICRSYTISRNRTRAARSNRRDERACKVELAGTALLRHPVRPSRRHQEKQRQDVPAPAPHARAVPQPDFRHGQRSTSGTERRRHVLGIECSGQHGRQRKCRAVDAAPGG